MAKIRRTPEQWQQILQEQAQGDLTVAQYCQQHHIATSCFFKWRRKLAKTLTEDSAPALAQDEKWLPVEKDLPPVSHWDLELTLPNGVLLKMKNG